MFEKEAEDSFQCKKVLYKWETDKRSYIDGFKDGAEFGYNKAFVEADKNLKAIVTDFNKEKCELLGIIQGKDKVIQELEKENAELKEQIEQMKCCENCRYYSRTYGHCYSYDEYQNCTSLSNWKLSEC